MRRSSSPSRIADQLLRRLESDRAKRERRSTDLQRDMVELNVLRAFGAAVNEGLDRAKIIEAIRQHVPRLFEYDVLTLLVDFGRPEMFVFPRTTVPPSFVRHAISTVLDAHGNIRGETLKENEVHILVDGSTGGVKGVVGDGSQSNPPESHVTLPLVSGGEHIGFLSITAKRKEAFGPLEVQLLSLISYQLSAAFRNASLFNQTRELAIRDALTGLFNRRHFDERLEEEHRRARRYGHPMSLVLCDIDHFKSVNDRFGHPTGDKVIKAVTEALKEGTRTSDILCRYGGEEFAVILPETSIEEGALVAERLRALVSQHAGTASKLGEEVHMSFGVAGSAGAEPLPPLEELVRQADGALYLAKQGGRNRVCAALAKGAVHRTRELEAQEKRRFPRFNSKLPLRYLVVPDLETSAPVAHALDVSPQGLRVSVDRPIPQGSFILLEFADKGKKQPIRVLSKVVWSAPETATGPMIGTRIVAVEGETRFAAMLENARTKELPPAKVKKEKKKGGG